MKSAMSYELFAKFEDDCLPQCKAGVRLSRVALRNPEVAAEVL